MTRLQIPRSTIIKSPGLLPMLYTVSEISTALDIAERTLRDWLRAGAPHTRDSGGHIWINRRQFADWITSLRRPKRERKVRDHEPVSIRCNKVGQTTQISTK